MFYKDSGLGMHRLDYFQSLTKSCCSFNFGEKNLVESGIVSIIFSVEWNLINEFNFVEAISRK